MICTICAASVADQWHVAAEGRYLCRRCLMAGRLGDLLRAESARAREAVARHA